MSNEVIRVLVADDDQEILRSSYLLLNGAEVGGHVVEVLMAENIENATSHVNSATPPDIVFLDVVMEERLSGLKFVSFIRSIACDNPIKIIIRTGEPGAISMDRVLNGYDIDGYIEKGSTDPAELFTIIANVIRDRAAALDHA